MPRLLSMSDTRRSRSVFRPLGARGAPADPYTCYMVASKFTLLGCGIPGTWYYLGPGTEHYAPEPPLYGVLVVRTHLIYCSTIVACMVCTLGVSDAW